MKLPSAVWRAAKLENQQGLHEFFDAPLGVKADGVIVGDGSSLEFPSGGGKVAFCFSQPLSNLI